MRHICFIVIISLVISDQVQTIFAFSSFIPDEARVVTGQQQFGQCFADCAVYAIFSVIEPTNGSSKGSAPVPEFGILADAVLMIAISSTIAFLSIKKHLAFKI